MEQGLYAKVVMIQRKDSDNKKEGKIPIIITSKGNPQNQYDGLILIMSGQKKNSGHVNQDFIKKPIKKLRGGDKKTKKYLQYQLVIQK